MFSAVIEFVIYGLLISLAYGGLFLFAWLREAYWRRRVPDYDREPNAYEIAWVQSAYHCLEEAREWSRDYARAYWIACLAALFTIGLAIWGCVVFLPDVERYLVKARIGDDKPFLLSMESWALALVSSMGIFVGGSLVFYAVADQSPLWRKVVTLRSDLTSPNPDDVLVGNVERLVHEVHCRAVDTHEPFNLDQFVARKSRQYVRVHIYILTAIVLVGAWLLYDRLGRYSVVHYDRIVISQSVLQPPKSFGVADIDKVIVSCEMCNGKARATFAIASTERTLFASVVTAENLGRLLVLNDHYRDAGIPYLAGESYDAECLDIWDRVSHGQTYRLLTLTPETRFTHFSQSTDDALLRKL